MILLVEDIIYKKISYIYHIYITNFSFEVDSKENVATFNTSNSQILIIIIPKGKFNFCNTFEKHIFETVSPIHFAQSCKTLKLTQLYVIYVLLSFRLIGFCSNCKQ